MRLTFASGRRIACVAAVLMVVSAFAAEQKQTLIGATREQLLSRYGEPRSVIVAGGREVMFFARERVILRNGVVVEVEMLPAEPASRRPAPSTTSTPDATPTPAPATPPTEGTAAATKTASQTAAGGTTTAAPAPSTASSPATPPATEPAPATRAADTAPVREPEIAIKSVRPPSGVYVRVPPPRKSEPVATAVETAPAVTAPPSATLPTTTPGVTAPPAPPAESRTRPAPAQPAAAVEPTLPSAATATAQQPVAAVSPTPPPESAATTAMADTTAVASDPQEATPASAEKKPAAKKRSASTGDVGAPDENIFTGSSYLIAIVVIGIGVGFLWWRRRQRQLELAATAVSRNPFTAGPAATAGSGERFTAEHLAKLDWKHFEELVAAYYEKTGVVAARTKAGPDSPVHIKISWKGESRPFALVQCIARPRGLVEVKPLQELMTVLSAEDIRRGYVVTTGKFSVAARDFAEEKHLTLMPGEIFLEKLNALPDSARDEVMQVVLTGDVSTPTCPRCEAKMIRSPDDPTSWQCPTHPDVTQPVAK